MNSNVGRCSSEQRLEKDPLHKRFAFTVSFQNTNIILGHKRSPLYNNYKLTEFSDTAKPVLGYKTSYLHTFNMALCEKATEPVIIFILLNSNYHK